jgi:hypothetical protein
MIRSTMKGIRGTKHSPALIDGTPGLTVEAPSQTGEVIGSDDEAPTPNVDEKSIHVEQKSINFRRLLIKISVGGGSSDPPWVAHRARLGRAVRKLIRRRKWCAQGAPYKGMRLTALVTIDQIFAINARGIGL